MHDQNLLLRNDTILGICEAIGTDFGFHPNWLRLALSAGFFFNPLLVAGIYLALGIPVALTRWMFPVARPSAAAETLEVRSEAPDAEPSVEEELPLPLAA